MSVMLVCSNCGKDLKASDQAIGQTVKCPDCGTSNHVLDPNFERAVLARLDESNRLARRLYNLHWWIVALLVGSPIVIWIGMWALLGVLAVSQRR